MKVQMKGLGTMNKDMLSIWIWLLSVCRPCNEICQWPSGHSFGPIYMKFGKLVYLWDT